MKPGFKFYSDIVEGCETCSACKRALKHLTTERPVDKTVVKILNNPKGDNFKLLNFYFVGTVALNVILICQKPVPVSNNK